MVLVAFIALFGFIIFMRSLHADKADKPQKKPKKAQEPWMGTLESYSLAAERMANNFGPIVLLAATYSIATVLSVLIQDVMPGERGYKPFEAILVLPFILGVQRYALAVADNHKLTLKEFLVFHPKLIGFMLLTNILTVLAIAGSLLLFVIPVIWVMGWYFLSSLAVIDKGLSPMAALKESKRIAEGNISKVWALLFFSMLINTGVNMLHYALPGVSGVVIIGSAATFASLWILSAGAILYRYMQERAE